MKWLYRMLILVGVLLILSPVAAETYTYYQQELLKDRVNGLEGSTNGIVEEEDPTIVIPTNLKPVGVTTAEKPVGSQTEKPAKGGSITAPFSISIPKIQLDAIVVNGVSKNDLRKGPGLYPQGSIPGEEGNVSIAAHRTTYGAWFKDVNQLVKGDVIMLSKGDTQISYEIEKVFTTDKNDWSVIEPVGYNVLTLTTCDPPGTVRRRLIVRARQVDANVK